jgi:kynurenine 3-monooxygenase
MPFANFEKIHNESDLLDFFKKYFTDAIELMGKELLIKEYFKNPKGSLVMIKVTWRCRASHRISLLIPGCST